MTGQPEALEAFLRRLDQRIGRLEREVRELKGRMTSLGERTAAGFNHLDGKLARQAERLDRMEDRLFRLERAAEAKKFKAAGSKQGDGEQQQEWWE